MINSFPEVWSTYWGNTPTHTPQKKPQPQTKTLSQQITFSTTETATPLPLYSHDMQIKFFMDTETSFQKQGRCSNYYAQIITLIKVFRGSWIHPTGLGLTLNHRQGHIHFQKSWLVTILTLCICIVKQLFKSLVAQDVRISIYTLILLLRDTILHVRKSTH